MFYFKFLLTRNYISLIIFSILKTNLVTPAYQEPLPGWVDNLNGPTGVMIGAGKGVIRSMLCNGELKSEVIPVDIAINGLIVIPYYVTQLKERYYSYYRNII